MTALNFNAVKSRLHYASKRVLSQTRRNEVKQWLTSRRKEWARFYVLVHGAYGAEDLVNDLRQRVPNDFEILMVHSAYDRLLPMYRGKSHELVQELIKLCGKDRTLVMPAFVLGGRSYNPCEFYRTRNFDVKRTPSEMGLLTELFRRVPGVKRSLHPTHSVCALGPLAGELTGTHHLASTRTGRGTPFEFMAQKQTVVAGVGIEYYRSLTQLHTAEDMLGSEFPVKFQTERVSVTLVDANGNKLPYDLIVGKTTRSMNCSVARSLLSNQELDEWRFKGTPLFVTSAGIVTRRIVEAARRGVTIYGGGRIA